MKELSLEEKKAREEFDTPRIQQAWENQLQGFGPILEPAFTECCEARLLLLDALEQLRAQELDDGIKKLNGVEHFCTTDADFAAWLFFCGLACDMKGDENGMMHFYTEAEKRGHRFFLPHLKMAVAFMKRKDYDSADAAFRKSLETQKPEDLRTQMIYCSTLINHSRCLLGMRRYADALAVLDKAWDIAPGFNGLCASRVLIYAAMGDEENCKRYLRDLSILDPKGAERTEPAAQAILEGKDPHYTVGAIDDAAIAAFWSWFSSEDEHLRELAEDRKAFYPALAEHLRPVFPELPEKFAYGFHVEPQECHLTFLTCYHATLTEGCKRLLAACPAELKTHWSFDAKN